MRYRLKLDEPVADGVRRIGIAQVDRAASALAEADRDKGIHEARKSFKRVRALLDMNRPALSEKVYRRENRRFRDLGRALAGPRDVYAMRQTLERLQQKRDLGTAECVPSALRAWLACWRTQADLTAGDAAMAQTRAALEEAREAFAQLPLRAEGIAPLAEGCRLTYTSGRKAMKLAYRDGVTDEAFHEWRKHVQRHWRHLQLVRDAWPEVITPRIDLASELSGIIGRDHDLAVLIAFIMRNRAILGARGEVKVLVQAARHEQVGLRAVAHVRGQRLYDLPPRAMARMIETNWSLAQAMAAEPQDANAASRKANVVALAQA
jgi:hypothetical protein